MSAIVPALRLVGSELVDPGAGSTTRNLAVEDVEIGEPGPGEVLVEPLFTGICGSDVSASLGKPNFAWVERPRTIGHEFSARILAFGPGAEGHDGLQLGDIVCPLSMVGCGDARCRGCRRGRPNSCRRKRIIGFHRNGGLAGRVVMEVDRCVRLLPGLTPEQGAIVEPLSVVAQGVLRKCRIDPGMDVVVSGCGIIGLMAAEVARAQGARVAVTGVERDRGVRLAVAERRGFLPVVMSPERPLHEQLRAGLEAPDGTRFGDPFDDGLVDVVIECSGAASALGDGGAVGATRGDDLRDCHLPGGRPVRRHRVHAVRAGDAGCDGQLPGGLRRRAAAAAAGRRAAGRLRAGVPVRARRRRRRRLHRREDPEGHRSRPWGQTPVT
jgi:L-iditol 2-dehydrogenase